MSLNPFGQVQNYASMLNRISLFTFLSAATATWLLRAHFETLDGFLASFDLKVDWGPLKQVPLGYLIPAFIVAGLARVIKLHDRLSDLFQIREQFDLRHIIRPLGKGIDLDDDLLDIGQLKPHRRKLMREAFYTYASSTDPRIDKHLIYEALDWWSWFWVCVEALIVWGVTAVALLFDSQLTLGLGILGACVFVTAVMLPFLWMYCARYAHDEVEAILGDDVFKQQVRKAFTCVTGHLVT